MTHERMTEMYTKLSQLCGPHKVEAIKAGQLVGRVVELKLNTTVPEALISLGVARTEEEASTFLAAVIAASVTATVLGKQEHVQSLYDFIKLGFQIGLLAGKEMKGREVN